MGPQKAQERLANIDGDIPQKNRNANNVPNTIYNVTEEIPKINEKLTQAQLHNEGKPYRCGNCPVPFSWYTELEPPDTEHRMENLIQCNVCSTKLISQKLLHEHRKWHRGKKHFYPCEKCPKKFHNTEGLNYHLAVDHKSDSAVPKKHWYLRTTCMLF